MERIMHVKNPAISWHVTNVPTTVSCTVTPRPGTDPDCHRRILPVPDHGRSREAQPRIYIPDGDPPRTPRPGPADQEAEMVWHRHDSSCGHGLDSRARAHCR
jgi:hypothetical protein